MSRLGDRIKERVAKKTELAPLPPPATATELAQAESQLGFELPHSLKDLYREVANGGFGPGHGFFGVPSRNASSARDLVGEYRKCSRRPGLQWPDLLLPVIYCGCDVFFCVDCHHREHRIIVFDGALGSLNESDISDPRSEWPYPDHPRPASFRTRAKSFEDFLEMWLADERQLYRW
jgi:hypothetical protein